MTRRRAPSFTRCCLQALPYCGILAIRMKVLFIRGATGSCTRATSMEVRCARSRHAARHDCKSAAPEYEQPGPMLGSIPSRCPARCPRSAGRAQ
eukprot:7537320-Alexandrium_andersonii.AAC.1